MIFCWMTIPSTHDLVFLVASAVAAYIFKLVESAIRSHVKNAAVQDALLGITHLAETVVKSTAQTVVADLKDPTKPGTWDEKAAASVKHSVLGELHLLSEKFRATLMAQGWTAGNIATLLKHTVESAVSTTA